MVRFDTLEALEKRFQSEAKSQLTPTTVKFPNNENLSLDIQVFKPNRTGYFYEVVHPKKRIVIHFTAGNLRSDMISLTGQNRHVSVPFVIARDGTIYNLFSSKYWSGHIGAGIGNAKGTGNPQDKATIGIELSNYGYLTPKEGKLETIYSRVKDEKTGKISPVDIFCDLDQTDAYIKLNEAYRNQAHYASYTPEQIDSLIILLRFLTAKYNIKREFLSRDEHFERIEDILNFDGIVTHADYRAGGKWDIGPAFDWNTLITGVQAAQYTPKFGGDRSAVMMIDSEDELLDNTRRLNQIQEEETTDNEGYNPNDFDDKSVVDVPTNKPSLHALLVGINKYDKVRKLDGCLKDIAAVEKYLNENTAFELPNNILKLPDSQATRSAIIDGFRTHLGQAKEGDTVLFYFSGHGTKEEANIELWKDETDKELECLVCYDGGPVKPSDYLIADKELRYLIHELSTKTKAHIVTIFDCCHSGDNTRNGAPMESDELGKLTDRRIDSGEIKSLGSGKVNADGHYVFNARTWEDFVFSTVFSQNQIKADNSTLAQGKHIQIAACDSDQMAKDSALGGVFTINLLETLKNCHGNVSYQQLRSRLRQYLRASYTQTPRIYAPIDPQNELAKGFLNQAISPNKMVTEATHNNKTGWQINVGALHGVTTESVASLTDRDSRQTWSAKVQQVFIDFATIEDIIDLDINKVYGAEVAGLMMHPIHLRLDNHDATPDELKTLVDAIQDSKIVFSGETKDDEGNDLEEKVDYDLHIRAGKTYLTFPDNPYRPLVNPLTYIDEAGQTQTAGIKDAVQHISRWHFIKQLSNPKSLFTQPPLKIELTQIDQQGNRKVISLDNDVAALEYEKIGENWTGTIELKITNITNQKLYVGGAYLSREFGCFLDFLPQRVQLLEAGAFLLLGVTDPDSGVKLDTITLKLTQETKELNWPQIIDHIKFIISSTEFSTDALLLEELEQLSSTGSARFAVEIRPPKPVKIEGWTTQLLQLQFTNPVYNQVSPATLKALLENTETSYFASGLYCEVALNANGQPTDWRFNKNIVKPEDERGLLDDFKMWFGNKIETKEREVRYALLKNTNRLRIVAEGDSWFQYPIILKDTLDYLYKRYAICSFAEAGDTLVNYLAKKEYLVAIKEEGAKFFLVSGGGNDVLGVEFEGFLNETPVNSPNILKKYLNQDFVAKLDELEKLYKTMFDEVLAKTPGIYILIHCYDYIIPVDTKNPANKNKSSWSGKYMIDKGIEPQAEREKLIGAVVDEYAKRLQNLTKLPKYKGKVIFVDTRNTVNRNAWHDEIHPINDGYELVANKFAEVIERLR